MYQKHKVLGGFMAVTGMLLMTQGVSQAEVEPLDRPFQAIVKDAQTGRDVTLRGRATGYTRVTPIYRLGLVTPSDLRVEVHVRVVAQGTAGFVQPTDYQFDDWYHLVFVAPNRPRTWTQFPDGDLVFSRYPGEWYAPVQVLASDAEIMGLRKLRGSTVMQPVQFALGTEGQFDQKGALVGFIQPTDLISPEDLISPDDA